MRAGSFVLGYHGCDREVGEKILTGQDTLRPSKNDYDWLGSGIYFWENNAQRAQDWAELLQRSKFLSAKVKDPFVLGAIIDPGNCLDLLEAKSISVVEEAHHGLKEAFTAADFKMPENKKKNGEFLIRSLDCAVINYLHDKRAENNQQPFHSVRAAFMEGEPIYENAGFHRRTHIQLCVCDPKQIIGYFRPLNLK